MQTGAAAGQSMPRLGDYRQDWHRREGSQTGRPGAVGVLYRSALRATLAINRHAPACPDLNGFEVAAA